MIMDVSCCEKSVLNVATEDLIKPVMCFRWMDSATSKAKGTAYNQAQKAGLGSPPPSPAVEKADGRDEAAGQLAATGNMVSSGRQTRNQ